jgi:membrane-associated phospholipid phosphatase
MTAMLRSFISTVPADILRSFRGRNLLWHLLAIAATFLIVRSGLDWLYFKTTRPLAVYLFPAVRLGWRVPVLFPVAVFTVGVFRKDLRTVCLAYATAQAVIIGLIVAAFYKALTGRPGLRQARQMIDTSGEFHFGFLEGGVFYGWPSSHTTVAFAMSAALWMLYPGNKVVRCLALVYALYVGVGVSMTIHWFSDFVAGAIIGTVIGVTVGRTFKKLCEEESV